MVIEIQFVCDVFDLMSVNRSKQCTNSSTKKQQTLLIFNAESSSFDGSSAASYRSPPFDVFSSTNSSPNPLVQVTKIPKIMSF